MFADISNPKTMTDFLPLLAGILTTEWTFIFAARRLFGKSINRWYTEYGVYALMSDVASILIGLLLARYLYSYLFDEWSLVSYTSLAVGIQVIHDILFYLFIIIPTPLGQNGILDILKPYAKEAGAWAIPGDSWMMIGSAVLASYFKTLSPDVQAFIVAAAVYILPYAIYDRPA